MPKYMMMPMTKKCACIGCDGDMNMKELNEAENAATYECPTCKHEFHIEATEEEAKAYVRKMMKGH